MPAEDKNLTKRNAASQCLHPCLIETKAGEAEAEAQS
jgi:hypothetical protein